jgi:hypothetical protein
MPKANLSPIRGGAPFQDFECSVCKAIISRKCDTLADGKSVAALKATIFKEWDAHLYSAHRRQWDFLQAKIAKRKAAE